MINYILKVFGLLGGLLAVLFGVYKKGRLSQKSDSDSENLKRLVEGYEAEKKIREELEKLSDEELRQRAINSSDSL